MTDPSHYRGGCLCGALRYEAHAAPLYAGHCYCADCRKASGSGFIPFLGFAARALTITGASQSFASPAADGGVATRNFCPACGGLVFGGERGISDSYTVYAGSLDEPADFQPTVAIFTDGRPAWALVPPNCTVYPRSPR